MNTFVDFIASIMFIDKNEDMDKQTFLSFTCAIIEIWCDKHGIDMKDMAREIYEIISR